MFASSYPLISSLYFSSSFSSSINSIKLEDEKQPTLASFAQFLFIKLTYLNYLFVTYISSNSSLFQPRKKSFQFQCINLNLDLKYILDYIFISTRAFHFSHDVQQGQGWKNSKKKMVLHTNVMVYGLGWNMDD